MALNKLQKTCWRAYRYGCFSSYYHQLSKEKISEIGSLDGALENVEHGIKEWELSKRVAMKQLYEPGVEEATRQLKTLHATKAMLLEKVKAASTERNELARTQTLIEEATTQWKSMVFEHKKQLVDLIVASADMMMESPHILKIIVDLKEPVKGQLVGYLYRTHATSVPLLDAERQIIRDLYAHADRADILQALPMRSWQTVREQASIMSIERKSRVNTSHIPDRVTWADVAMLERLALTGPGVPKRGGCVWKIDSGIRVSVLVCASRSIRDKSR